jgi:hypothetical protein
VALSHGYSQHPDAFGSEDPIEGIGWAKWLGKLGVLRGPIAAGLRQVG